MPSMPRAEWMKGARRRSSYAGSRPPVADGMDQSLGTPTSTSRPRLGDTIKSCEQLTVDERSDQELKGAHQAPPQIKIAPWVTVITVSILAWREPLRWGVSLFVETMRDCIRFSEPVCAGPHIGQRRSGQQAC